jgi:hypothetical protein
MSFLLVIYFDGVSVTVLTLNCAVVYKWRQAIPKNNFLAVNLGALLGFFYTAFVLNLTVMGFLVSDWNLL